MVGTQATEIRQRHSMVNAMFSPTESIACVNIVHTAFFKLRRKRLRIAMKNQKTRALPSRDGSVPGTP
jgi:hypothetical protein